MRRKRKERERELINKQRREKKRVDLSVICSTERKFYFIPAGESQSQTKESTECCTVGLISKALQSEGQKSPMSSQSAQRSGETWLVKPAHTPPSTRGQVDKTRLSGFRARNCADVSDCPSSVVI